MSASGYDPKKGKDSSYPSSDVESGIEREDIIKYAGGNPDKLHVDEIDKVNMPTDRKRAPGSVRV